MNISFKFLSVVCLTILLGSCGLTQNTEVTNTGSKVTQETTAIKAETSSSGATDAGVTQTSATSTGAQETVQSGVVQTSTGLRDFETVIFANSKLITEDQKIPRIGIRFQYPRNTYSITSESSTVIDMEDTTKNQSITMQFLPETTDNTYGSNDSVLQETLQIGGAKVKKYYAESDFYNDKNSYIEYVWDIKGLEYVFSVKTSFKKTDTQVAKIIDQIARSVVITQDIKPDTTLTDKEYTKNIKRVGGIIYYNKASLKTAPVFVALDGADAATFETYEQSGFMKDKYRVYNYESEMAGNYIRHIENADPTTFKVTDYLFARDKDTLFRTLQGSYVWIDIQEDFELINEKDVPKVKIGGKEYLLDFTGDDPHVVGLPKDKKNQFPDDFPM